MYLELSQQQIDRVAELAGLLTPVTDIAALMELDEDLLRMDIAESRSAVSRAFRRAVAQTALEIRRQELEFARMGSPAAVQSAAGYLAAMEPYS